jgi:hypothetical protein
MPFIGSLTVKHSREMLGPHWHNSNRQIQIVKSSIQSYYNEVIGLKLNLSDDTNVLSSSARNPHPLSIFVVRKGILDEKTSKPDHGYCEISIQVVLN